MTHSTFVGQYTIHSKLYAPKLKSLPELGDFDNGFPSEPLDFER